MKLRKNPFYILGATLRDNRAALLEKAEEKALNGDADAVAEAKALLTNPRRRLSAELSWLPGISPQRALELVTAPFSLPENETLPALASLNYLLSGLETMVEDERIAWLYLVAEGFDLLEVDEITSMLNEERAVAGFAKIQDSNQVGEELQALAQGAAETMAELIWRTPNPSQVLEALVEKVRSQNEKYGTPYGLAIIGKVVAKYETQVLKHLSAFESAVEEFSEKIAETLKQCNGAFTGLPQALEQLQFLCEGWDALAQPIQMTAELSGADHEGSQRLGYTLRALGLLMANEYGLHQETKVLSTWMQEIFAELPQFAGRLQEDNETLEELLSDRRDPTEDETEESGSVMVGKEKFEIANGILSFGRARYKVEQIERVRWGVLRNTTNGITSTYATVWVGDSSSEIEIECKKILRPVEEAMRTFDRVIDLLWKPVTVRIITTVLGALGAGKAVGFKTINLTKEGVILSNCLLFRQAPILVPWKDVEYHASQGTLTVQPLGYKSKAVTFSFRDDYNTPVLNAVLGFLVKDGHWKTLGA